MLERMVGYLVLIGCVPFLSYQPLSAQDVKPAATHQVARIGLLSDTSYFSEHATDLQWDAGEQLAGLRQGMKDLGVVEGKDWILIPRIANRDHVLLEKYAADLVAMNVDVIAASSTTSAMAAAKVTNKIPIVGWGSLDGAVRAGPGTNVTGFRQPPATEYIEQLHMFVPDLKRLAVLYDPTYAVAPPMLEAMKHAAEQEQIELLPIEVGDTDDLAPAFEKMVQQHAQGVIVLNNSKFNREREKLAALGIQQRLPILSPYRDTAEAGVLMAHHPDWEKIWRRAAKTIQQILDGTAPGQIPIQTGEMRYYINVKTANALGLTIPKSLQNKAQLIGADAESLVGSAAHDNSTVARDEAAIRAIVAEITDAWNRQDAKGVAAHRTEESDHINVAGKWDVGLAAFEQEIHEYFQTHHPRMTSSVEKLRFLTPDVAYVVVKRQYKDDSGTREAISLAVFRKIKGEWWNEAFQNTFVRIPAQENATKARSATDVIPHPSLGNECR